MASDEPILIVDSRRYFGWKSIRITRSIESICGSFALEVSDRWDGERDPWPIAEGDVCRVLIGDDVVISGYIDKRNPKISGTSRSLSYSGRDRAGDLVDSSAIVNAAGGSTKWSFHNVDVFQIAKELATPHGIPVSVQPGLATLTKQTLVTMDPGDKCFEVISKLAAAAGVLVVSDGLGGIVITRSGAARATPLVLGQNLKSIDPDFDMSDRFYRYIVTTQAPTSDQAFGAAANVQAEAFDLGVPRKSRVLIIRPDKAYTAADCKRRADWEARVRAARSEKVVATVQGWRQQPNGKLWPINAVTNVRAHEVGVDGDLLISQVDFTVDSNGGRMTKLSLVRPDAFEPEPSATVVPSSGLWKELEKGGL